MHADRRQLLLRDSAIRTRHGISAAPGPYSGALRNTLGHHAKVRAGADQCLLHHAHEIHRTQKRPALAGPLAAQIEDGVADQLSRPVIGHIAAAVHLMLFHVTRSQPLVTRQYVGARCVPTHRNYWRMLQQKQRIADHALLARRDHARLDRQGLCIGHTTEMEQMDEQIARRSPPCLPHWRSRQATPRPPSGERGS